MLNKSEKDAIVESIENIYAVKFEKLMKEKEEVKNKLVLLENENKTIKEEIKSLKAENKNIKKELDNANKIVAKYDKLVNSLTK